MHPDAWRIATTRNHLEAVLGKNSGHAARGKSKCCPPIAYASSGSATLSDHEGNAAPLNPDQTQR